ncbi:MAG TPA: acyl-CoA dehydrogenase family protein [Acidimicrobiales bacterium]|nr:acyl-CoA dehydrogenase family protein [Acidimicrobiales bacterium]
MTDTATDVITELKDWLNDNWDPDLTVAQWWERLGLAGWAAPGLPENAYGKGLSRADAVRAQQTIAEFGALGAPGGLGLLLAAPTIATHGTQEQIDLYVRDIVTGQKAWCQLFSEPGAGSDLAGLTTKGVKDGDEWTFNGQKVWTSGGQIADLGMLLARTNVDVPKHQGISYFALDMHQPGVDVRPLREITGHAMFNEVFISDARAHDDTLIGGTNNGWAVANTTLAFERSGLGAGGGSAAGGMASPGTVVNDLDKRVGDFVSAPSGGGRARRGGGGGMAGLMGGGAGLIIELAKNNGKIKDATVRQDLMKLHTLGEIAKYNGLRSKALRQAGQPDIPGGPNIAKLQMSMMLRLTRDTGMRIIGPYGTLHGYTPDQTTSLNAVTKNPFLAGVTGMALYSPGPSIYGGTDEVQHNIIGERVLGLPKEPNNDKTAAFKDLPKNG